MPRAIPLCRAGIKRIATLPASTVRLRRHERATPSFSAGFTLIEMIVAVALFTVVMVVALTALTSVINADRKAQAIQTVIQSLQFSLDDVSRIIRTGTSYSCYDQSGDTIGFLNPPNTRRDCASRGSSYMAVEKATGDPANNGDQAVYWFSSDCRNGPGGTLITGYNEGANRIGCIERSTDGGATYEPLTPSNVAIDSLRFYVKGALAGDSTQPHATVTIQAHIDLPNGGQTKLHLQTLLTQRVFDQ